MVDPVYNFLLQDLAVVMLVAGIVTLVFHQLRQPVVLGYLLAGVIIGPHTPPFPMITDPASIRTLADLGVVFLMFSVGLQFSVRTLRDVGATAVIASALEIMLMLWLGYELGQWFGWSKMDSIFLGAMLSITSTTIIVKTLTELGLLKERFTTLTFGIQVVEDMLGIAMIAVLSGVATTGSLQVAAVAQSAGQIVIYLIVVLALGLIAIPPLLRYVARFKSEEMLLVTVLALCFGMTLATLKLGYSLALGAFLIGSIIGETREIGKIKTLLAPMRDAFSAVFFVAIGMLINPRLLLEHAGPILVITVAVVLGKGCAFSFGTFVAGNDLRTALRVGTSMVPIGELSFIMAALGVTLGVTSEFLYPIAVGVAALTMLVSPYLMRHSDQVVGWVERRAPPWLLNYLELYSRWVQRLGATRSDKPARRLAWKWAWQIGLNMALVTGVFMAAAGLAEPATRWWPGVPEWIGGAKGLLWASAAVVALPGLIAAFRKLQALALLVAESSVGAGAKNTAAIRAIIAHTVVLAGGLVIGLWVLLWSAAIMPGGVALAVLVVILALLVGWLWRFFIQIHAKAQVALRETLSQPAPPPTLAVDEPLPTILRDAQLETITLEPLSPATGKLIRELALRTKTGASIVGIERAGGNLINPAPDEELLPGDRVLALGNREQLAAARALLLGVGDPPGE